VNKTNPLPLRPWPAGEEPDKKPVNLKAAIQTTKYTKHTKEEGFP
jgi:hypothetical protein